jgi:hypothetical protein
MQNYQQLELPVLMEILASETALYAKMLAMGFTEEEFKICQQAILELQVEIETRKKLTGSETTISDPDIFFERQSGDH